MGKEDELQQQQQQQQQVTTGTGGPSNSGSNNNSSNSVAIGGGPGGSGGIRKDIKVFPATSLGGEKKNKLIPSNQLTIEQPKPWKQNSLNPQAPGGSVHEKKTKSFLNQRSPLFGQEFPSLNDKEVSEDRNGSSSPGTGGVGPGSGGPAQTSTASGGGRITGSSSQTPASSGAGTAGGKSQDTKYGPGPSLRPQTSGNWLHGGAGKFSGGGNDDGSTSPGGGGGNANSARPSTGMPHFDVSTSSNKLHSSSALAPSSGSAGGGHANIPKKLGRDSGSDPRNHNLSNNNNSNNLNHPRHHQLHNHQQFSGRGGDRGGHHLDSYHSQPHHHHHHHHQSTHRDLPPRHQQQHHQQQQHSSERSAQRGGGGNGAAAAAAAAGSLERDNPMFQQSIIDNEKLKRMDYIETNADDWTKNDDNFDYNKKLKR